MTVISNNDVQDAKRASFEYWKMMWERFDFFRDDTVPVPLEVFDLPSNVDPSYHRQHFEQKIGYHVEWFARFWANDYVNSHISYVYLNDYKNLRETGLKEKDADKKALKLRGDYAKRLKELYP